MRQRNKMKGSKVRKKFSCDKCPYESFDLGNLKKHKMFVHDKIRDHVCEECGKQFSLRQTLKNHVMGVHLKIKDHALLLYDSAKSDLRIAPCHKYCTDDETQFCSALS